MAQPNHRFGKNLAKAVRLGYKTFRAALVIGGMKHNVRAVVKAITYRKGGIFQYATIGGGHPWYTDNMLQLPALEADLFGALKDSALDVLEVRAPAAGLSNIAYAKIRKQGPGDGKQAIAVMLGASKMEILIEFNGQNYRDVYRAFGTLRPRLGRVVQPPFYPYTFSAQGDFVGALEVAEPTKTDIRHHVH